MSSPAKRLFMLIYWLEVCQRSRHLDEESFLTECRIREQASHLIGFLA